MRQPAAQQRPPAPREQQPLQVATKPGEGASITPDVLIRALLSKHIVTEEALVELLGPIRNDLTLPKLEKTLVVSNTLTDAKLATLVGAVSGRTTVADVRELTGAPALPETIAAAAGAIVVTTSPLTVAFVEDTDRNTAAVTSALNTDAYDTWLVTATQFQTLLDKVYPRTGGGDGDDEIRPLGSIHEVIDEMMARGATDLHLKVGDPPAVRVDSEAVKLKTEPVSQHWMYRELVKVAGPERLDRMKHEPEHSVDFAYSYGTVGEGGARFRVNVARDSRGEMVAMRKLNEGIPSMDELSLPDAVRRFSELERGLVLVTGPTGSGKSTTLAAILGEIARTQPRHVLTLEDPVEYELPTDGKGMVSQRELGDDFGSFPGALKAALRQDPDVILVGEMRDAETIEVAVTAAETGHLVFSTLHTYDAASTLNRIINAFAADEQDNMRAQLAHVLKGVVSQTLCRKANGRGRIAAFEILVGTPAVQNNLRRPEGVTQIRTVLQGGREHGMCTLELSLAQLVKQRLITPEEAMYKARKPEDLTRMLQTH